MNLSTISKLWRIIKQIREEKFNSIADDPRPLEEKEKDYLLDRDVYLPMGDVGKRITSLPFEPLNQGRTSACGAFSAAHMRKISENVFTDPIKWYRTRSNYDGEGMFIHDVLKLAAHAAVIKPPTKASKLIQTEKEANAIPLPDITSDRKLKYEYSKIEAYDADGVFKAVSVGYPTLITFYCTKDEWIEEMTPWDGVTLWTAPVRHYVVAIPGSVHQKDGHTWVSVVDSSPAKGYSIRQVRKDFLEKRMYLGGGFYYPVKKKEGKVIALPLGRCRYGQKSRAVKELQVFLVNEGYMADVHTTSYYGNITASAVLRWQLDNIGTNPYDLIVLEGKHWGPLSISTAKIKYPNV